MVDINFSRRLNELIEEIKSENENSHNSNPSYLYLIDRLTNLSMANIESQKGVIMHFIADSYSGSKNIGAKVAEFISLYTSKKRKK
ncbi:MAG: hypothetical protein JST63_06025 [Bacteroidetes bacterium]|nr:hypothetical protein [Bacteroidota bacterium]